MEGPKVIIENGTTFMKCGFSGDDFPRSVFRPIVGIPRKNKVNGKQIVGCKYRDTFVGDEAFRPRNVFGKSTDTIENARFTNWSEAERLWSHVFSNELRVVSEECHVFMPESAATTKDDLIKIMEIIFEEFQVISFASVLQPKLSLFSTGLLTGTVLDSGGGLTSVTPILNGETLPIDRCTSHVCGKSVDDRLKEILSKQGHTDLILSKNYYEFENIKKQCCKVARSKENIEKEFTENKQDTYKLPDGQVISLEKNAYKISEVLFDSSSTSKSEAGINDCLKFTFEKLSNFPQVCENVVISGGTSLLKGFPERIKSELQKITQNQIFKLNACDERRYNVFIGASVLSSLNYFNQFQLKREIYNELGSERSIFQLHPIVNY